MGDHEVVLYRQVEELAALLAASATGGADDEARFRELRRSLRQDTTVGSLMPAWLAGIRTLDEWWPFIKQKFASYRERREFVREAFDPARARIEELDPSAPEEALPPPRSTVSDLMDLLDLGGPRPATEGFEPHEPRSLEHRPSTRDATHPLFRRVKLPGARRGALAGIASRPKVFIVHGRDHGARDSVTVLVQQLGLQAVVLEDQPSQGRTLIEKVEDYADVAFAIVVMTPDDVGGVKGETMRPRARQNVILELGFFIGVLGRGHVAALIVGQMERPSDVNGVAYTVRDLGGAWKTKLAREMQAAGLPVDLNDLR